MAGVYSHCPNCSNQKKGTSIERCTKCKKIFCTECRDGGFVGKCPQCGNPYGAQLTGVQTLGKIK